jgi:tetratricopeptide (TPR) repeat protein
MSPAEEEEVSSASDQSQVDAEPPKTVDEWKALGNEAVKSGDHASAVECYSAGLKIDSNHVLLLSNRALCLHKLGRLEDGLVDAKRCGALRPDFVKGFLRGALILRELDRPQEALELLRKAPPNDEVEKLSAEVRPEAESAESRRISALTGAERQKEEGNVLFKKGLFEQALEVYSDALALCSEPNGELALAIRNNRAGCYHQLSNFELVVEEANIVLTQQPHNLKALIRRMIAFEPLEKYEAALDDARRVLSYAPGNEQANRVQHRLSKLVRDLKRERDTCA